ncbi:MAG: phenylalanine--tRNA ligase subunit beta [Candidatus Portnoybacteria bacterium RBG_13_40_8]|uniref:Phenylalanine--tRNA ligase beta subunit n=1 Tax=Candidatus Portnoybacteria bacterium RBG_13_40_8 TaxID=1801990 RepID=A0A1G2F2K3_9BACT|nr:MAG: phenylalanine--tRNA ligase subunit beta [Candidatus Portnoybacteria bacterium RBG_13_40_8]
MKVSYNWLEEYVEKLPKPEKLAELLSVHSFEVKSVEKSNEDYILDIDILPNRAHDCLSHIGIARECVAVANSKFKIQNPKFTESKNLKTRDFITVEVQDRDACPRYTARVITDIKIEPSPTWMQKRLAAIGQKPINNVVDATNYVMFETGQPLHAFDYEKLEGKKIIIRGARKGEKIITLDNEICELNEGTLIIADAKNPLALAGVKGGKKAEITVKTKTIVLESANFDIKVVRATCRETGIKTESSIRFEYGLDPNLTEEAINRVTQLIKGKITKGIVDIYSKKTLSVRMRLNLSKIENILGIRVSKQQVIKYLKSLGFIINDSLRVTVPTIRRDIEIEEDLIEEIARLIGYNNIVTSHPFGLLGMARLNDELIVTNKVKTIFESAGFNEVYNISFVGEADIKKFDVNREGYIELENPLSIDLKYLRKDLLINLIKDIKDNSKTFLREDKAIKIFELGKTYRQENKKIEEERMLTGLIVRRSGKMKGESFYETKGLIDSLLNKLGISDVWYDDFQATPEWTDNIFWQRTETAEIKVGDEEIGFIGEINTTILNKLNIKAEVAAFNLNFEKLLKLAEEELIYKPPSLYPAAVRDLAVLVNLEDRVADIQNIIEQIGGELVFDVDLFDMYEGEEIPDGKKNLAFHIIYQSYEKTLKDEEVDKIHRRIIRELEKNKNWEVRK